jgi:hypothetical protein
MDPTSYSGVVVVTPSGVVVRTWGRLSPISRSVGIFGRSA